MSKLQTRMNGLEMRTFAAVDYYDMKGRGRVWTGPSPITYDRDIDQHHLHGEWLIDHPEAEIGRVYIVTAVESHCVQIIRKGAPIGLLTSD